MATNSSTNVDALEKSYFESPKRLDGPGGTASFFRLELTTDGIQHFKTNCLIGKESSGDNIKFYEQQKLDIENSQENGGGIGKLLEYTFEYVGSVTLQEMFDDRPSKDRKLLVLKSPLGSYIKPRLLQFRIENSAKEGSVFRLERFDGQPQALISRDPLHDFKVTKKSREKKSAANSEAQKKVFQKMSLCDVLMHYLDIHEEPNDAISSTLSFGVEELEATKLLRSEVAEIVLDETVCKLGNLLSTCRLASPQNWLRSRIGIGYDAGNFFPDSESAEQEIRANVIVCIFDWEGSKLRSEEVFRDLSEKKKEDIKGSWVSYMKGIRNLFFHAANKYHNQFSNLHHWNTITVRVMDYDSSTADDFMGEVTIDDPVREPGQSGQSRDFIKYPLMKNGKKDGNRGSILIHTSWQPASPTSRLSGLWRITIGKASKLQIKDFFPRLSSDPYCLVIASSKGKEGNKGYLEFQQQTKVVIGSLEPDFGETLEIPVLRKMHLAKSLSSSLLLPFDALKTKELFGSSLNEDLCSEEVCEQLYNCKISSD